MFFLERTATFTGGECTDEELLLKASVVSLRAEMVLQGAEVGMLLNVAEHVQLHGKNARQMRMVQTRDDLQLREKLLPEREREGR